jgi:two-component system cell cycle sensor histidine kinase/response regulator CckA
MGGHLFELLGRVVGSEAETTLRIRIFRLLSATTAVLCLGLVVPTNLLQNLDIKVHVANVLMGLFSAAAYVLSRRGRHLILAFIVTIVLMLDAVWFWNGGSHGTITYFFFPVLLYVVAMFRGRTQGIMIGLLTANVLGLMVVEAQRPEWITPFLSVADRRIDVVIGIICSFSAVTAVAMVILASHDREQQRLEQTASQLRRSEERLRLCLLASAQGWFEINVQTGRGESSPEYVRMIGHDPATYQTTLEGWVSGIHPEDRENLIRAYRECIAAGDTRTMEYRRQTKSGGWKWIRSVGRIVEYDSEGRPLRMYGTHADITDRKELEAQLRHSQRLEAVGTLASGVAHDLNNILTPMLMATGILRESLADPRDRELMALLDSGGKRGAAIVKQLLDFSRNLTRDRVRVDPDQVLRETEQWMRSSLPPSITVRLEAGVGVPSILADPTQVHQVMMNLCVNARDAMPSGGTLTLSSGVIELPPSAPTREGAPAGGAYVVLSVTDTGSGIDPAIRDRIFDPFFTTKEQGKGTGLGLASVHGIVKAHGGFVRVDSAPGQGSTFRVHFPVAAPAAAPATPAPPPPPAPAPGVPVDKDARPPESGEGRASAPPPPLTAPPTKPVPPEVKTAGRPMCILVVDDEEPVRLVTRRRLEREGYRVLTASGGEEALAYVRDPNQNIDLVLTDFAMPGMDGPELAPRIRTLRPALPIIGMSGHDQSDRAAELAALGFSEVLSKPYEAADLFAALRRRTAQR